MVKTRFAPSNTGNMHLGSAKAALMPYVFAKKNMGSFILRIDNTDGERSREIYTDNILKSLKWLGIIYEGIIIQNTRNELYDYYFNLLIERGYIYECYETQDEINSIQNSKRKRKIAPIFTREDKLSTRNSEKYWRFDLNQSEFAFNDIIFGPKHSIRTWSDPVVKKPNGDYTYCFVSVIDDIEENITHIIRGSEHLSNTFIQINMAEKILGHKWNIQFAHFPLFFDEQGNKFSKRENSLSIDEISSQFDPFTLWSALLFLGSNKKQVFSYNDKDYINNFELDKYSCNTQTFSIDLLYKTQKKLFSTIQHVENIPEDIVTLLKTMASNTNELENLFYKIRYFNLSKSFLQNIHNIDDLNQYIHNNKLDNRTVMLSIYNDVFNTNFGPRITDLLAIIHKYAKKS